MEAHKCHNKTVGKTQEYFNCAECGIRYKSKSGLYNHIQKVHKPNPMVQCKLCPKTFTKQDLRVHLTKGACMNKHKCTVCGKLVSKLMQHMGTVHMDDSQKRFTCNQCSKAFFNNKLLENHKMNVHLKLRPHKCRHGCDQTYNDTSNRNQHEKRTHGALGSRTLEKIQFQELQQTLQ